MDELGNFDNDVDLAIVSSPLQYMNAVEQRAAAGRPADLVLIGDRHAGAAAIDGLMARKAPWRVVLRHGRRPRPPRTLPKLAKDLLDLSHRASLDRLARRLAGGRRRQIVFGDYRNVSQRLLVDRLAADELVLLDDGSVTPQSAAYRAHPAGAPEPAQFDLGWFRTKIARAAFGDPPLRTPPGLTFFTIYAPILNGAMAAEDRLERHGYGAWRSSLSTLRDGAETWLLGADHAEAGICSFEDYRSLVLDAVEALRLEGRGPIVYRPHRGEGEAKARSLCEAGGMRLVRTGTPVELDYLDAERRPGLVVVVASSAADTLAVLDPELEIARIALPAGYLRRRAEHIRAVVAAHDAFNPRLRIIAPRPGGA